MKHFGPDELLDCYRRGVFPMAENRDDPGMFLLDPDLRGIIPLNGLHISKSLQKVIKRNDFNVTANLCFDDVVNECARETLDRPETWINSGIKYLYNRLHEDGNAHSVEVWQGGVLVGGLYGVSIGAAFFGESMFSRAANASKVALVELVIRLNEGGFELLDTQFITGHLKTMGAVEISRADYHSRLAAAIEKNAKFE